PDDRLAIQVGDAPHGPVAQLLRHQQGIPARDRQRFPHRAAGESREHIADDLFVGAVDEAHRPTSSKTASGSPPEIGWTTRVKTKLSSASCSGSNTMSTALLTTRGSCATISSTKALQRFLCAGFLGRPISSCRREPYA